MFFHSVKSFQQPQQGKQAASFVIQTIFQRTYQYKVWKTNQANSSYHLKEQMAVPIFHLYK